MLFVPILSIALIIAVRFLFRMGGNFRTNGYKWTLPFLVAFSLLMLLAPIPTAHAQISGGFGLWVFTWLSGHTPENAYQSYPGGTIYLNYGIVDSLPVGSIILTQVGLTTPWQTYSNANVPVTIAQGNASFGHFAVTIPSSEAPGNVTWTYKASVAGYVPISYSFTVAIFANPTALQNQIDALDSQVASLQSQVSSLQAQLTTAQNSEASLQGTVTSLAGQVSSLQAQLGTSQKNATSLKESVNSLMAQLSTVSTQLSNETAHASVLTSQLQSANSDISNKTAQITALSSQLSATKASLATANSDLTSTQGELATTQTELVTTQGELGTYSSIYLPVGVAVPVVLAILFLVLYLRKGRRPSLAVKGMRPKRAVSDAASPAQTGFYSKVCPNCGAQHKASAKVCTNCGARFP